MFLYRFSFFNVTSKMNENGLIQEAKEIIEILHKTSQIMQNANPMKAYIKSKEEEATQLQNQIDVLAQRTAHIRYTSQHTKEEDKLQRIFHIYQVIHFHKLLTTDKQKFSSFHFSDSSFPSILKHEMSIDEICNIMLSKFNEIDAITFNTLLLVITETEESLKYFYKLFSDYYKENSKNATDFLMKWIESTPEIFIDQLQLERKLFPTNSVNISHKELFSIANGLLLQPFCNKPIQVYDKFELDIKNMDNLIHDFDKNIKEVFGPYSSEIKGFGAKDVANCFFVIFSLVINQRTIGCFIRKRVDERKQFLTIIHSAIHDSIMNEFQNTLEKYLNNQATDNELLLIIKRFHSILDECKKLNCDLLNFSFVISSKGTYAKLVQRFKEHKFVEGLNEWDSVPKSLQNNQIESSALFKEKISKESQEVTKNQLPVFIGYSTECIHVKDMIIYQKDGKINIYPFFCIAQIFDIINGSQRTVESDPISMPLLYSVLSFMFKNITDPKLMKQYEIE